MGDYRRMMFRGIEIDQRKLYLTASIAMGIVAVGNTSTFIQTMHLMIWSQIASGIGGLVLNYAFWGFFVYLFKSLPPTIKNRASESEMRDILSQAVKGKQKEKKEQ